MERRKKILCSRTGRNSFENASSTPLKGASMERRRSVVVLQEIICHGDFMVGDFFLIIYYFRLLKISSVLLRTA